MTKPRITFWKQPPRMLAAWSVRSPRLVLGLAVLVTLFTGGLALQLDLNNDFSNLLPPSLPAVRELNRMLDRVGGVSHEAVMVGSPSVTDNRRFLKKLQRELHTLFWTPNEGAAALAQHSQQRLGQLVRDIFYQAKHPTPLWAFKLQQNIKHLEQFPLVDHSFSGYKRAFFKKHQLLYLSVKELKSLSKQLKARVKYEIKRKQPGYVDLLGDDPPSLDFTKLKNKYKGKLTQAPAEHIEGKKDGLHWGVLIIRPTAVATNINFSEKFTAKLSALIAKINPKKSFNPKMQHSYIGGFFNYMDEYHRIGKDLKRSTLITAVLLLLLLYLFFRSFRALLLIAIPLLMGAIWAFGFSWAAIGYLNTSTGFVGALLLGFGIDYGIYLLSRLRDERSEGKDLLEALDQTFRWTGQAMFIASVTSAAAFFALQVSGFRGFSQFGLMAGTGILLCLLAMCTVLPAMVILLDERFPNLRQPSRRATPSRKKYPLALPITLGALLVFGGAALVMNKIPFESDMKKLSFQQGGLAENPLIWKRFEGKFSLGQLTPILFLSEDPTETKALQHHLLSQQKKNKIAPKRLLPPALRASHASVTRGFQAKLKSSKPNAKSLPISYKPIESVLSAFRFVPEQQKEKLAILKDLRSYLDRNDVANLLEDPKQRQRYLANRASMDVSQIGVADLPPFISRALVYYDKGDFRKQRGYLVVINSGYDLSNGDQTSHLYQMVQFRTKSGNTLSPSGEPIILAEITRVVKQDTLIAFMASLLAIFLLVYFDLRSFSMALLSLWPLAIGILGLLLCMGLTHMDFNVFNLLILPVLVGLGIDSGVHLLHRFLEKPEHGPLGVTKELFGPLSLAAITTVISFASMITTHHNGMRSIGMTAGLGLITTLLGALVFLPALMQLLQRYAPKMIENAVHAAKHNDVAPNSPLQNPAHHTNDNQEHPEVQGA